MEKPTSRAPQGSTPPTTFVQADASTFRELVQRLTGLTGAPKGDHRTPTTSPSTEAPKVVGVKKPTFKLHERRQYARPKLEIVKPSYHFKPDQPGLPPPIPGSQVSEPVFSTTKTGFPPSPAILSPSTSGFTTSPLNTPSTPLTPSTIFSNLSIFEEEKVVDSDLNREEEEKAIRERRFYLHPSPQSRPGNAEPELLTLFPLTSPKTNQS